MVFEEIKKAFSPKKRDPFDTKGLEGFTAKEQERILGKIGTKEAELRQKRVEDKV